MSTSSELFDSYGAWFAAAKLESLDDDELNYCLQANFQLGDWLLHFHEQLSGRQNFNVKKTKLNAPNSSKKSKLDVLNMVVELIKTEGKNMGEVQLEKGLSTLYRTGTLLTNECYSSKRDLVPEPEADASSLNELLFKVFEAVNTDSADQMFTAAENAITIPTSALRQALPRALVQFDLNWTNKQSAFEITEQLDSHAAEISVADLIRCAKSVLVARVRSKAAAASLASEATAARAAQDHEETLMVEEAAAAQKSLTRKTSVRATQRSVASAAEAGALAEIRAAEAELAEKKRNALAKAAAAATGGGSLADVLYRIVDSLSEGPNACPSDGELATRVTIPVLVAALTSCLSSMGDDAVQFPVDQVGARLAPDDDGMVDLHRVLEAIKIVVYGGGTGTGGGYRNTVAPGNAGGYRNMAPGSQ